MLSNQIIFEQSILTPFFSVRNHSAAFITTAYPTNAITITMAALIFLLALVALTHGGRTFQGRIAGGKEATPDRFKHQVSIRFLGRHICGGALIKPTKVVTAARCIDGLEGVISELTVLGGTVLLNGAGGEVQPVSDIKVHPKFSGGKDYDVALLKLQGPFKTAMAQPIELIPKRFSLGFTDVLMSGWGSTEAHGEFSPKLLFAPLLLLSSYDCEKFYPTVTPREVCCKNQENDFGVACHGDSGSPVITVQSGKSYLVAVVSGDGFCERPGLIDVFTNIQNTEITEFIESTLN